MSHPGSQIQILSNISINKGNKAMKFGQSLHSHKKRKDSLEGGLDRVFFETELKFPKMLVPRLLQHTSDVNMECARKSKSSKHLYSLYATRFLEH